MSRSLRRPAPVALLTLVAPGLLACSSPAAAPDAAVQPAPIDATPTPDAFVPLPADFELLSETGLYADVGTRTLADGVFAYEPAHELWADGADKERYLWIPPGETVDTSDMDGWRFPPGTRAWKTFTRPELGLIETRLVMRRGPAPEDVLMTSFVWNEDETDAVRAPDGAAIPILPDVQPDCPDGYPAAGEAAIAAGCHFVPPEDDCIKCHDGQAHQLLGFQAVQLSRDGGVGPDLAALAAMGLLSDPPPGGETYPVPGDPVARAALGYLHANCGHCHNRDLDSLDSCFGMTTFEARIYTTNTTVEETPTYESGVNDLVTWWTAEEGNTGGLSCRITPGDPDLSAILRRMNTRDGWLRPHAQMPPEYTARVDDAGVELVRAWIASLAEPPSDLCAVQ